MRYFREFNEEEQERIIRTHNVLLKENLFYLNEERITDFIDKELKDFRVKWELNNSKITYSIEDGEELIFLLKNVSWKKEELKKILKKKEFGDYRRRVLNDIELFEQFGLTNFFVNLGMHKGKFELSVSRAFTLTNCLTVEERFDRINMLSIHFEEDEVILSEINDAKRIAIHSKKKKEADDAIDKLLFEIFQKKRKFWHEKFSKLLEEDFEKSIKKITKEIQYYNGDEFLKERLMNQNTIYFSKNGEPLIEKNTFLK